MSHFAQIDNNNIVTRVLVIEQDIIDTGLFGDPKSFIQTSYNTNAGKHLLNGTPLRKNYAGVGFKYDRELDAFVPPKIYNSWILNTETCVWEAPIPIPDDGKIYTWNEENTSWIEKT